VTRAVSEESQYLPRRQESSSGLLQPLGQIRSDEDLTEGRPVPGEKSERRLKLDLADQSNRRMSHAQSLQWGIKAPLAEEGKMAG
jgi:hypothetical protein